MITSAESMPFGSLSIGFDERVLRPRPWTVAQSTWATELLAELPPGRVLELCTGAGQIGLLAIAPTERELVAVDLDPVACSFAEENASAAGLAERVEVRQGPMDEVLGPDEQFVLVVADPPWVREAEVGTYPEDPVLAIDGGPDGMQVAWTCLEVAERHLLVGGALLLQLGPQEQVTLLRKRCDEMFPSLVLHETQAFERGTLVRLSRVEAGNT